MGKITTFLKKAKARLSGDKEQLLLLENEEKMNAVVDGQIAQLKFKLIEQGITLRNAEKALEEAKYPITVIATGNSAYQSIISAQEKVDKEKKALADLNNSLQYAQALKEEYSTSVEE